MTKRFILLAAMAAAALPAQAGEEYPNENAPAWGPVDTAMSDRAFFGILDLDYPGLQAVKAALRRNDIAEAKTALCAYYRERDNTGKWWSRDFTRPDAQDGRKALNSYQSYLEREGYFDAQYWEGDTYQWDQVSGRTMRMYFFGSLATAYRYTGSEKITRVWMELFRSWIQQNPYSAERDEAGRNWLTLMTGIRLRSGWNAAFVSFVDSPLLDDESLFVYLKSTYEQARHLRDNHSDTSNWLTFEMAGLYSSVVLFPEWKESAQWKEYVLDLVVSDLDKGWLPDGFTIELSPGYGQMFYNYLHIYDLARDIGQGERPEFDALLARVEELYMAYVQMMKPDGTTQATNDNGPVRVPAMMEQALKYFPEHEVFQWAREPGAPAPDAVNLRHAFPYAGFFIARSGWSRDATFLSFNAAPVGYRHAHQDKLSLIVWTHGKEILFDSGLGDYSNEELKDYAMDTFGHNTGLVDNRPQRRRWYQHPSPERMPYGKLDDFHYESNAAYCWMKGVYDGHYGLAGTHGNDAYPYFEGTNFFDGWGEPARQTREVWFNNDDIIVVLDQFETKDGAGHEYQLRWHFDSTRVEQSSFGIPGHPYSANGYRIRTKDFYGANLEMISFTAEGRLSSSLHVAEREPEIAGWHRFQEARPATTAIQKVEQDNVRFLTLILPSARPEERFERMTRGRDGSWHVVLKDGRGLSIHLPEAEDERLHVEIVPTRRIEAEGQGS